jgi:hypothetical protein
MTYKSPGVILFFLSQLVFHSLGKEKERRKEKKESPRVRVCYTPRGYTPHYKRSGTNI